MGVVAVEDVVVEIEGLVVEVETAASHRVQESRRAVRRSKRMAFGGGWGVGGGRVFMILDFDGFD